jgi:hypothetical protein
MSSPLVKPAACRVILIAGLAFAALPPTAEAQWRDVTAAAAMSIATGLDLSSTFACRNPARCREGNPLAAVFYNIEHPGWLIAADAVGVALITRLGYELRRSRNSTVRRLWWVPAAAFTAGSLIAWRLNTRDLARCPECRVP